MTWLVLVAALLASFVYWLHWRWSHRRMLRLAALIPGPPALPILGNALLFMTKPSNLLNKIAALFDYGDYVRFWLGSDLNVVVKNPTDIRLILTSNKVNHKGQLYDYMKEFLGPGLLSGANSLSVMTWLVLVAALLASFVYWLHWRWSHRRMLRLAALIPGPPALPILGNALLFMTKPSNLLNKIAALFDYGDYVRFWLGSDLNVVVKNPTDIRLILTSNKVNHKGQLYDYMKEFLGPGLLSGGDTWRRDRKIASPSFSKKILQNYEEVFNMEADILAKNLCEKNPNVTFDVFFDVLDCATQSVCQTLMGLCKCDSRSVKSMNEAVLVTEQLHALIFEKMTKWWLQIPLIYRLTGRSKKQLYHLKLIDEMTSDIISKRKRALNGTDNGFSDAVLDRFILSGDLTEGELRSATHTLFMTSQDVVAKIASAVLVFLAHLPDWQERVYNEILQVLGPQDDNVTEEDWKKLTNLDMVFKEVLRYMTIGPLIQRTVEKEVTIKNGTLTIPVGASVVIPIHFVHRDSQNWEEPNKVNPGRFHPDCLTTWDPDSFIPFSLGAMDCIGRLYGISLVKTLVIRVLRRVKFEADGAIEDLELNIAITVVFAKGYNLRASKRETNDVKPSSKTIGIKK